MLLDIAIIILAYSQNNKMQKTGNWCFDQDQRRIHNYM